MNDKSAREKPKEDCEGIDDVKIEPPPDVVEQADEELSAESNVEMIQVKKRKTVGSYKFKHLATCYQFGPWIKKQREARCVFCNKRMAGSKPGRLASHINNCEQAPSHAKETISKEISISKQPASPEAVDSLTTTGGDKNRKRKPAGKSRTSSAETDRALAEMIKATNLPLNFVEMPSVKEFFRLLDPTYKLPTLDMIKVEVRRS